MKQNDIKKMTPNDLKELKNFLNIIDPKNRIFSETQKIIESRNNSKDLNKKD